MGMLIGFLAAESRPIPGHLGASQIEGFDQLAPERQQLIQLALEEAARLRLGQYIYGSHDPDRGGFDCSGAIFYLLKKLGLNPARSSSGQFEWLKEAGTLHQVPAGVRSLDDPSFAQLRPGDLLFWSGTYETPKGRKNKISHVQMYLGVEKGRGPVMIGSTDGRSYRGEARCGFGVFDFKLPSQGSRARFAGYGKPPALPTPQN
jgi:cell wall-associated NlpC family hydrolase